MEPRDDGLNAARGIVNALAMSAVFWLIVLTIIAFWSNYA